MGIFQLVSAFPRKRCSTCRAAFPVCPHWRVESRVRSPAWPLLFTRSSFELSFQEAPMPRPKAPPVTAPPGRAGRSQRPLDPDDAFIALLIAAMDASGHVSADEAARAHNIIWSMRRFRHRSGERVGHVIARMKALIASQSPAAVLDTAARKIPRRLRPAAFAMTADLVLVDGRMERSEARFLRALAVALNLKADMAESVLAVMRIKNSA